MPEEERLSDRLDRWLGGEGTKTLGSLIEVFGEKSFAVLFVILLAIPALPLPTGGVTHVFELIAMLLAIELIAGRREVWLPDRWCRRELSASTRKRFSQVLVKRIRWLERHSRPRLAGLLAYRLSGVVYGAVVLALIVTAFVAPPFSGLDTLPALGVVLISLGVLLEDALLGLVGAIVGAIGVILVIVLGRAAFEGARHLL
ncbi:MAG: exopolysaccharide biosynthesis protein [Solirubrobacterales bacterium]